MNNVASSIFQVWLEQLLITRFVKLLHNFFSSSSNSMNPRSKENRLFWKETDVSKWRSLVVFVVNFYRATIEHSVHLFNILLLSLNWDELCKQKWQDLSYEVLVTIESLNSLFFVRTEDLSLKTSFIDIPNVDILNVYYPEKKFMWAWFDFFTLTNKQAKCVVSNLFDKWLCSKVFQYFDWEKKETSQLVQVFSIWLINRSRWFRVVLVDRCLTFWSMLNYKCNHCSRHNNPSMNQLWRNNTFDKQRFLPSNKLDRSDLLDTLRRRKTRLIFSLSRQPESNRIRRLLKTTINMKNMKRKNFFIAKIFFRFLF